MLTNLVDQRLIDYASRAAEEHLESKRIRVYYPDEGPLRRELYPKFIRQWSATWDNTRAQPPFVQHTTETPFFVIFRVAEVYCTAKPFAIPFCNDLDQLSVGFCLESLPLP